METLKSPAIIEPGLCNELANSEGQSNIKKPDCSTYNRKTHPNISINTLDSYLDKVGFIGKRTKRTRVICWLYLISVRGYVGTRFDALSISDSCLNSTISDIQKFHGIQIDRRWTKRQSKFGPIDCAEYWLQGEGLEKAERYLSGITRMEAA